MQHVLVTGFEPFDGDDLNPSQEVARRLHGRTIAGAKVQALELPCVFGAAAARLREALAARRPALVFCLGLAALRDEVSVERVAINIDDARIPDNAGTQPIDTPVVTGAPAAYFATLPVKAIVAALRGAGLPAALSSSAGTFVCNHVFYALMHELSTQPALAGTRGGFVHLPALPGQRAAHAGLAVERQTDALHVAIAAALAHRQDIVAAEGSIA